MVAFRLAVRLTPRGGRDCIEGWSTDASGRPLLKARVTAPPVDGAANAALLKLIARALGRPAGVVSFVSGETGRVKILQVEGLDEAEGRERLDASTPR
jgi:uncharacterized protein YggU (UPF0235/DUF167 family)